MVERLLGVVAWPGCLLVTGFLSWQRWQLARLDDELRRVTRPVPEWARSLTGYVG